jgi:plastocyanin
MPQEPVRAEQRRFTMRRIALSVLTLFALAALTACGGGGTTSPASSAAVNPSAPTSSGGGGSQGASAGASGGAAGACAMAPAGSTATVNVSIKDFKYTPQPVQAKVGDIVAWKNEDSAPHTATMDDGSCDTGQIAGGATGMLLFSAAGTYTYHCAVHPGQMKDVTVEVK